MRRKKTKLQKLRDRADGLWKEFIFKKYGDRCVVCGKPAVHPHHFYPKGLYGHLRYSLRNGVPLCFHCHFSRHHKGDPKINQKIIEVRGKRWYNKLTDKAYVRPQYSYQTVGYYEKTIQVLTREIKKLPVKVAQK